jgi:MEMO1 family protein
MSVNWYPKKPEELNKTLTNLLSEIPKIKNKINGLIVPHAGYEYSGKIAGKTFSQLKNIQIKKAIILSPSHYIPIAGVYSHNKDFWETSLGKIKISFSDFPKTDIQKEHAIDNQIPFLQKLGFTEILPLLIGELTKEKAKEIAEKISKFDGVFVFSTDLSHFLEYTSANKKDKKTIEAIEKLNEKELIREENSACGIFPLMILIELCKLKNWKPRLIEYKNSGDIMGLKNSVVGYAGMIF